MVNFYHPPTAYITCLHTEASLQFSSGLWPRLSTGTTINIERQTSSDINIDHYSIWIILHDIVIWSKLTEASNQLKHCIAYLSLMASFQISLLVILKVKILITVILIFFDVLMYSIYWIICLCCLLNPMTLCFLIRINIVFLCLFALALKIIF